MNPTFSRSFSSVLARVAAAAVLGTVSLAGCDKALDLSTYTQQATALAQTYAPQLKELSARLPDLVQRAKDIPDSVPGAASLKKVLADNQDAAAKLQGLVNGLTDRVGAAVKSGKPDEVQKTLSTTTAEIKSGVIALRANVDAATSDLEKVEAVAGAPTAASAAPAQPADFMKKLASGVEIKGAGTGIESQLIAFIEDASKPIDKSTWFNFDRLTFQTGKAELDLDKSQDQLTNINEILKAYPAVTLKVGGYTDNVGKPAANLKLSQQRADAVMAALVAGGIDAARLSAEGFGQDFPACPGNATAECKAQNRRIAVSVRSK